MATIILGTLNINGCRNAKKRAALLEYIYLKKSSVVLLQECHSNQDNQPQWEMDWKGPVFLSHGSSVSAGVATLLSPGLPWQGLSHVSIIAGRLHRVDATGSATTLCLEFGGVYIFGGISGNGWIYE